MNKLNKLIKQAVDTFEKQGVRNFCIVFLMEA